MLKPLIKRQTIKIDDHRRGGNVIHDWNDKTSEVHIHKECNYNGKEYEIIIPLNQNNPARCMSKGINEDIPRKIIKEVNEVFSDADCRERFLEDVYKELYNYSWKRNTEDEKAIAIKVAEAFDLKLLFSVEHPSKFTQLFEDSEHIKYHMLLDYDVQRSYIGERCLGLMRGISAEAKDDWIQAIDNNLDEILRLTYASDRAGFIIDLAKSIRGIGPQTTDETIAYIENMYFN